MSLFATLAFSFSLIFFPLLVFSCPNNFSCGGLRNLGYPFGKEVGCGDPDFQLNECQSDPYILRRDNVPIYLLQAWEFHNDAVQMLVRTQESRCNISDIISGDLVFGSHYQSLDNVTKLYICEHYPCQWKFLANKSGCENVSNVTFAIPYQSPYDNSSLVLQSAGFLVEAKVQEQRVEKCEDCLQNTSTSRICGYNASDHSFLCFPADDGETEKKDVAAIAGGVAGTGGILLFGILGFYMWKRRSKKCRRDTSLLPSEIRSSTNRDEECGRDSLGSVPILSYEELKDATNSFSHENELGEGGFGSVYLGRLKDGRQVAVKRLHQHHTRRVDRFLKEAQVYSKLLHPNVVRLYGCTSPDSQELLLVFEYVPNGTLADHLHGDRRGINGGLSLVTRLKIALQTAEALFFLHNNNPPIFHRDVKSLNILLDEHMDAKVADFGLCRPVPVNATHVTTVPQGSPGYVDPEYHQFYQLTEKSDVYSFGVVLVEIISGKLAVDVNRDRKDINLANMAVSKIQEGALDELLDHKLRTLMTNDGNGRDVVKCLAELAFRCLASQCEDRPAMKEVVDVLRELRGKFGECKERKKGVEPLVLSPVSVHEKWPSSSSTPTTS